MNFDAHMRVGSLEIMAAMFVVALVASRPRFGSGEDVGIVRPMRVALRIIELGKERAFEGLCPLTIGRGDDAGLRLADPEVSRRHARLEAQGKTVYVRDLASSNGTFLNGHAVAGGIEIRKGDEIDVGTTRLVVGELIPWT